MSIISTSSIVILVYLLYLSFIYECPVGVQKARKIAGNFKLPIVGVHHMEAHALVARYIKNSETKLMVNLLSRLQFGLYIVHLDVSYFFNLRLVNKNLQFPFLALLISGT